MAYIKYVTKLCINPECASAGERRKHYGGGYCESCWKALRRGKEIAGENNVRKDHALHLEYERLGYSRSERQRDGRLRRTYGITLEDRRAMPQECAICGSVKSLSVDHCHTTGKVRNLLCTPCNTALGKFRDDPALLRAAALYLESHR